MVFIASAEPGLHARNGCEQSSVGSGRQVGHGTTSAEVSPGAIRKIANDRFRRIALAIFSRHSGEVEVSRPTAFPLALELARSEILAAFRSEEASFSLPPVTEVNQVDRIFAG